MKMVTMTDAAKWRIEWYQSILPVETVSRIINQATKIKGKGKLGVKHLTQAQRELFTPNEFWLLMSQPKDKEKTNSDQRT